MKLNLNLATAPLENRRRFITAAALIGFAGLVAFIILGQQTYTTWRANRDLRTDISRLNDSIRTSEQRQQELSAYFNSPEAKQALERSDFLNSLIQGRTFPWPRIFDDLERCIPGGVRVVSISPKLEGGRANVKLAVGAADDAAKVKFLRALEDSKAFTQVEVDAERHSDPSSGQDRIVLELNVWYSTI